jgi:hypothetical protein
MVLHTEYKLGKRQLKVCAFIPSSVAIFMTMCRYFNEFSMMTRKVNRDGTILSESVIVAGPSVLAFACSEDHVTNWI